jgi:hypothetical protein
MYQRGAPGGHHPPGRATPSWRALMGGPHLEAPLTLIPMPYSHIYGEKYQGERIIAFHETKPPPPPVLPWEARSGVLLGLRRGGSSSFIITNLSPSPIP